MKTKPNLPLSYVLCQTVEHLIANNTREKLKTFANSLITDKIDLSSENSATIAHLIADLMTTEELYDYYQNHCS